MIRSLDMRRPVSESCSYKSKPQQVRALSENWFQSNMYCPYCLNEKLGKFPNNHKAADFFCPKCSNVIELKSSSKTFSARVPDGEYHTMVSAIKKNQTPDFHLLNYREEFIVRDLMVLPKFFISESVIERRKPLSENAQRAGWIGCNIVIKNIPLDGRVSIIKNEKVIEPETVQKRIRKFLFLQSSPVSLRGWTLDVWKCIEDSKKEVFDLEDIYRYEAHLKDLHQDNNNVQAKIRQQLQLLRDHRLVEFLGNGKYRVV